LSSLKRERKKKKITRTISRAIEDHIDRINDVRKERGSRKIVKGEGG